MLTTYLCIGHIDGLGSVTDYIKAKSRVEAKKKMRKQKRFKGVKYIKALECIS